MATQTRRATARKTVKKAQTRRQPGTTGAGNYYHVEVRPKSEFVSFRTQDVGRKGHIQRVAGKRSTGSWSTAKWLISKDDAHVLNGRLVPDSPEARKVLNQLGSKPVHTQGDRFKAKDRPNVPERSKPTAAQQKARRQNIKKAQAARNKK